MSASRTTTELAVAARSLAECTDMWNDLRVERKRNAFVEWLGPPRRQLAGPRMVRAAGYVDGDPWAGPLPHEPSPEPCDRPACNGSGRAPASGGETSR